MRKIGFMPYKESVKEILPSSFNIAKQEQKRKMFICMLNELLPQSVKIHSKKKEYFTQNLRHIFMDKVFSFLPLYKLRPFTLSKIVKIYNKDSPLFMQFLKLSQLKKGLFLSQSWEFDQKFIMRKDYEHPMSSLMTLIFNGKEIQMMLDLNSLFAKTIYKRIKPANNTEVSLDLPYIHINQKGRMTRLIPTWKKVNPAHLQLHHKQIRQGFKQLEEEAIDQCYLIYPKNDSFRKHIVFKDTKEHQVKMVPYSFTFTQKNQGNKTRKSVS